MECKDFSTRGSVLSSSLSPDCWSPSLLRSANELVTDILFESSESSAEISEASNSIMSCKACVVGLPSVCPPFERSRKELATDPDKLMLSTLSASIALVEKSIVDERWRPGEDLFIEFKISNNSRNKIVGALFAKSFFRLLVRFAQ